MPQDQQGSRLGVVPAGARKHAQFIRIHPEATERTKPARNFHDTFQQILGWFGKRHGCIELKCPPTVDDQGLAGNELGGEQKHNGIGDFLGAPRPPKWGLLDKVLLPFRRIARHRYRARSQGVHAHRRAQFFRQHSGHQDDPSLRNRMRKKLAPSHQAADIGEINDRAMS